MKEAGQKLACTLDKLLLEVKGGITTSELDAIAEKLIRQTDAIPAFKGYEGFPGTICVNINDGLVHGVPTNYQLKSNDLLTIDIGLKYRGYCSDMATSVIVDESGDVSALKRFLSAGKESLSSAIAAATPGNRVGDISAAMQFGVERYGYDVSDLFTGHGVGKDLHEDPSIPCYGRSGQGPLLKENMVLAIEVIYAEGSSEAEIDDKDHWTVKTMDGSNGGLFEHTILVTDNEPLVLTKS